MLTQSSFSGKDKSSKLNINKNTIPKNRGVELLLKGGKRKQTQSFHIIFDKMVCFLGREVNIYFELSLSSRNKRKVVSRRKKDVSS